MLFSSEIFPVFIFMHYIFCILYITKFRPFTQSVLRGGIVPSPLFFYLMELITDIKRLKFGNWRRYVCGLTLFRIVMANVYFILSP